MQFDGALIKEQGVTFAIAVVKHYVLHSHDRDSIRNQFKTVFGNIPIILMAQDSSGIPQYYGRKDIVNFLANIELDCIPWQTYTITA
ncbi:hypothetical protein [Clostridium sp. K25]|uniref:hypothetical protein n=1 Tax=Clostridium sp. K25 TaxID=1443109 RepID=UPI00057EC013|nr:hypothetical protein [Clostridium sp. K25]